MRARTAVFVLVALISSLSAGTTARAAIFLGGSFGWLENDIYKTLPVGSPYLGGAGGSYEIGFDLGPFSLSGELGPSYNQPPRNISASHTLGLANPGKYKMLLGNLTYRLDPIESLQPYLLIGGGQGEFTLDYGKGMRFGNRLLKSEKLKSWVAEAGFGFESPIRSWLIGGLRGRFLYNRWQPKTDTNRYPQYQSGNAYSVDLTLKIRL